MLQTKHNNFDSRTNYSVYDLPVVFIIFIIQEIYPSMAFRVSFPQEEMTESADLFLRRTVKWFKIL